MSAKSENLSPSHGQAPTADAAHRAGRLVLLALALGAVPVVFATGYLVLLVFLWGMTAFCFGNEGDGCSQSILISLAAGASTTGGIVALARAWFAHRRRRPWVPAALVAVVLLGAPFLFMNGLELVRAY